jgi:hypothetical protein
VEEYLIHELQAILDACHRRGIAVFVIGAFGVRAYGSLLRRTLDLDLLNVTLPVFTLEGLLITKLIALRDNDVVDSVALLSQQADQVVAARFWDRAAAAGLESALESRLAELEEMLTGGEVEVIWWDRLGLMLDESERQAALKVVRHLQAYTG